VGRAEQELTTEAATISVRLGSVRIGSGGALARAAALVSGAALLLPATCKDGADRFTTHGTQIESRVEGDVDVHYAWLDPAAGEAATLVTLAPFHAAAGRDAYTKARLDELLGGGHTYASLAVWRFGGEGALALGRDGIPVAARAGSGSIASLPPSKWPAKADGAQPLLATLGGASALPALAAGQSLQLLVVFATSEPFAALDDVKVTLGGRTLELTHARATAVAWDEFRSLPARERFEVATGLKPGAKSTDGGDTHAEREGER
jgi:hypothetical protein